MNSKITMWCDCGECAKCRPDLHKKENECVKCGCYNLTEFKKVERQHIHCLDCYRQVRNAKQREYKKIKKEGVICEACGDRDYFPLTLLDGVMRCSFCVDDYNNGLECECCGERDKSVGLATGDNGVEMWVCRFCDVDGSNYDGWGDNDDESVCVCKGCGQNIEENGFCSEGCRFGEFAGVWTCDCGEKCKDVEFCPKCGIKVPEEKVNCFVCDKLYCKSHSYCILGHDDMPYCSKECFLNCEEDECGPDEDEGSTTNEDDDEEVNPYMEELIECRRCEIEKPRKNMYWNTIGSYTDVCEDCEEINK